MKNYLINFTKKIVSIKTFLFSITYLFLIKTVVFAGDIFTGTQNLFSDVKTKLMILAPFVSAGVIIWKLILMQMHEQQEQMQDKKAIKWAFIILVLVECVGGLITWLTGFYSAS